jgi:ParB family chromosome partitioning protein
MRLPTFVPSEQAPVVVGQQAAAAVVLEARRSLRPVKVAWIGVGEIDETPPELNSRQTYDEASINELATSIQEVGLLQPVCVRPQGARYTLVFGMRRFKAAIRAGLAEVPCTIQVADDDHAFLLNSVENLHQKQLSGTERVRTIERLAATNLGVREIGRRTGFSHATISKWLRLADKPIVLEALQEERLDIARAMALAPVRDEQRVAELVAAAPSTPQAAFYELAKAAAQGGSLGTTYVAAQDDARLADAKRKLSLVRVVSPLGRATLLEIRELVAMLLEQADADRSAAAGGDSRGGDERGPTTLSKGRVQDLQAVGCRRDRMRALSMVRSGLSAAALGAALSSSRRAWIVPGGHSSVPPQIRGPG